MSAPLLPGERELWTGSPVRFPVFRSGDLLVVPFTFAWWGFALFWEYSVAAAGAPVFMLVWGLIFVLVGAHLAVGRLVVPGRAAFGRALRDPQRPPRARHHRLSPGLIR